MDNLAEHIPVNDLDPVEFDSAVREMLMNWANWEQQLPPAIPSADPGKQPMFREVESGYNVEDDNNKRNKVAPRFDEAEFTESIITRMSPHDKSVLERYFIRHQNTVVCAGKMGMSRRKFEAWLNTAIGKFGARIEDDNDGMDYVFRIIFYKMKDNR